MQVVIVPRRLCSGSAPAGASVRSSQLRFRSAHPAISYLGQSPRCLPLCRNSSGLPPAPCRTCPLCREGPGTPCNVACVIPRFLGVSLCPLKTTLAYVTSTCGGWFSPFQLVFLPRSTCSPRDPAVHDGDIRRPNSVQLLACPRGRHLGGRACVLTSPGGALTSPVSPSRPRCRSKSSSRQRRDMVRPASAPERPSSTQRYTWLVLVDAGSPLALVGQANFSSFFRPHVSGEQHILHSRWFGKNRPCCFASSALERFSVVGTTGLPFFPRYASRSACCSASGNAGPSTSSSFAGLPALPCSGRRSGRPVQLRQAYQARTTTWLALQCSTELRPPAVAC